MGLFSPVWRLLPFVPQDVLVLVFWWERSQGEGFYSVEGDGVFPGPVGQDVYARVSQYGVQVHVARDGGGRQRLAQGRGAWGGAGRVMVLTPGLVDAVRGDVYGEGSDGALEFVGLDVVEARHRPVWERPSLIHTASARDAAGFRQSVVMPVIVRLRVASDTLAGKALMRGLVWSSWRVRALRLALCRCWASLVGVCIPVCLGFLLRRSAVWKGVGQEGAWWRVGVGGPPVLPICTGWPWRPLPPVWCIARRVGNG